MKDSRDALDFGTMNVPRLFVKLFVPTLIVAYMAVFSR